MVRRLLGTVAAVLVVAAALVLAGWFVFASLTGATLITFRTGSMSPTMPQGALAVSLPVTAEEIAVGDVVTVQRADSRLPVTHRVVEVRLPPDAAMLPAGTRELVLQGDDNDTVDSSPYVVADARRVVFAVPRLGTAIMLLQTPLGMGALGLLAGALTVWAFWPRRPAAAEDDETGPGSGTAPAGETEGGSDTAPVAADPLHADQRGDGPPDGAPAVAGSPAPAPPAAGAPQTRRERRLAEIGGTPR